MLKDGKITAQKQAAAQAEPLGLKLEVAPNSLAPYFVEEVRKQLEKEYGVDEVHGAGLRVYTTLDLGLQQVANQAVLDGTARYETRHGWKGGLQNVVAAGLDPETYRHPDWSGKVSKAITCMAWCSAVNGEGRDGKAGRAERDDGARRTGRGRSRRARTRS